MIITQNELEILAQTALNAAIKASDYIQSQVNQNHKIKLKEGVENLATQVVTAIDIESQRLILEELKPSMLEYDLGLLTEELPDDGSRFTRDYFWCIDPLDGTLPFTEKQPGYAVSIALIKQSGEPVIGVVADPHDQKTWLAIKDRGVLRNDEPISSTPQHDRLICRMERSFLQSAYYEQSLEALQLICKQLGYQDFEIRTGYGAVMNALSLLEAGGCFFKFPKIKRGGGCIWDYAATRLIYEELGYAATTAHGNSIMLNRKDNLFMNDVGVIYATDSQLHQELLNLARQFPST